MVRDPQIQRPLKLKEGGSTPEIFGSRMCQQDFGRSHVGWGVESWIRWRFCSQHRTIHVRFPQCGILWWWRVSRKQPGRDTHTDWHQVARKISMPSIFPHFFIFFLLVHGLKIATSFSSALDGVDFYRQTLGCPWSHAENTPRIQGPWIETWQAASMWSAVGECRVTRFVGIATLQLWTKLKFLKSFLLQDAKINENSFNTSYFKASNNVTWLVAFSWILSTAYSGGGFV